MIIGIIIRGITIGLTITIDSHHCAATTLCHAGCQPPRGKKQD
jgi:hypothetical protein